MRIISFRNLSGVRIDKMRRRRKGFKEIRVGVFIVAALAIMVGTVFFIGGQRKFFGGKVKYKILFDTTGGLYEGDPVLLTGVEVGNVTRLGFPEEIGTKKILVEITVLKEVTSRIRRDTRARIAAASLVYGKVVELTMGSPEEPVLTEGAFIEAEDMTNYAAIVDSTTLMVEDIRRILSKLNRGEGMVGMLLNEPLEARQTLHHLAVSSMTLARILDRVEQGRGPLGVLLSDSVEFHQTIQNFKTADDDFGTITENLKGKESAVGRLINDPEYGQALMDDLRSAVHSLANVAAKIDTGKGTLGSLINDKELYYGLQDVVLGVQRSSVAKWLIQNRRKAGEKERMKRKAQTRKESGN